MTCPLFWSDDVSEGRSSLSVDAVVETWELDYVGDKVKLGYYLFLDGPRLGSDFHIVHQDATEVRLSSDAWVKSKEIGVLQKIYGRDSIKYSGGGFVSFEPEEDRVVEDLQSSRYNVLLGDGRPLKRDNQSEKRVDFPYSSPYFSHSLQIPRFDKTCFKLETEIVGEPYERALRVRDIDFFGNARFEEAIGNNIKFYGVKSDSLRWVDLFKEHIENKTIAPKIYDLVVFSEPRDVDVVSLTLGVEYIPFASESFVRRGNIYRIDSGQAHIEIIVKKKEVSPPKLKRRLFSFLRR